MLLYSWVSSTYFKKYILRESFYIPNIFFLIPRISNIFPPIHIKFFRKKNPSIFVGSCYQPYKKRSFLCIGISRPDPPIYVHILLLTEKKNGKSSHMYLILTTGISMGCLLFSDPKRVYFAHARLLCNKRHCHFDWFDITWSHTKNLIKNLFSFTLHISLPLFSHLHTKFNPPGILLFFDIFFP